MPIKGGGNCWSSHLQPASSLGRAQVRRMHVAQQAECWSILQSRGMQLLVQLHGVPAHQQPKQSV